MAWVLDLWFWELPPVRHAAVCSVAEQHAEQRLEGRIWPAPQALLLLLEGHIHVDGELLHLQPGGREGGGAGAVSRNRGMQDHSRSVGS